MEEIAKKLHQPWRRSIQGSYDFTSFLLAVYGAIESTVPGWQRTVLAKSQWGPRDLAVFAVDTTVAIFTSILVPRQVGSSVSLAKQKASTRRLNCASAMTHSK